MQFDSGYFDKNHRSIFLHVTEPNEEFFKSEVSETLGASTVDFWRFHLNSRK